MTILVDTHTHTVASCHAYSTLKENAELAYQAGLEGIVVADHGPSLQGCAPPYILTSVLKFLPEIIEGVRVVKGTEANIINLEGGMDLKDFFLDATEFGIASMHTPTMPKERVSDYTDTAVAALRHPRIHVIGHPGNPNFPLDYERFVKETARLGKLVEVNNHSFEARAGSGENCRKIVQLCKKHDVRITVSSDAHSCYNVGGFERAVEMLEDCGFPEELIVNTSLEKFLAFLEEHKS